MKSKKYVYFEVMLYVIILVGISIIALRIFRPNTYHDISKNKIYVVITDSMSPTIHPYSMILVNRSEEEIQAEDIITFEVALNSSHEKKLVTHRVDSCIDEKIYTRSDKHHKRDTWVLSSDDIIGKVKLTIPYLGYLIMGVQKVALPLLIIAQLLIVLLLAQTMMRWKKL